METDAWFTCKSTVTLNVLTLTQSVLHLQKEKAEAVAEVVSSELKCDKLERYARTLTGQRKEMEKEIRRLNEVNIHHRQLSQHITCQYLEEYFGICTFVLSH